MGLKDNGRKRVKMKTLLASINYGATLVLRDGREITFLHRDTDGNLFCQFGPGEDQLSWWGADGRAEYDDPDFVSDADIVAVKDNTLFN